MILLYSVSGQSTLEGLTIDYLPADNAIGVSSSPRFSWKLSFPQSSDYRGTQQTDYQLTVSAGQDRLVWDTGRINSSESVFIPYTGPLLNSSLSYDWQVTVWTNTENKSISSPQYQFMVGLKTEEEWEGAEWMCGDGLQVTRVELPKLSLETYSSATLTIAAPGCVIASVDGVSLDTTRGVCPWINFDKTTYFTTYDLLRHLSVSSTDNEQRDSRDDKSGGSVVGVMLGRSMWGSTNSGIHARLPVFRAVIKLTPSTGGPPEVIITKGSGGESNTNNLGFGDDKNMLDSQWIGTPGPFIADNPFTGTIIDWRLLPLRWDTSAYSPATDNTTAWKPLSNPAQPQNIPKGILTPFTMPPVTDWQTVTPKSVKLVKEWGGDVYMYDLGVNLVGTCEVQASSSVPGGLITTRGGEMLLQNGSLNQNFTVRPKGVKAGFQMDQHSLRGTGETEYLRPSFTWYGMQYVSVQVGVNVEFNATLASLTCYQMLPSIPVTGSVEFSDDAESDGVGAMLNRLQEIVLTSQKGNFANYAPTDCPTREKHFWLGDALDTAEEAMYNFGAGSLFANFLQIIKDTADPTSGELPAVVPGTIHARDLSWTTAYPLIAYQMYMRYDDISLLRQHYTQLSFYMSGRINASAPDIPNEYQWGDWCNNQSQTTAPQGNGPALAGFNFILALDAMGSIADVLGLTKDAGMWRGYAETFRPLWHEEHYKSERGLYGYDSENGFVVQTLTSAALKLGKTVIPAAL